MRVLYEAYKHDPRDPTAGSGSDYHFLKAIEQHAEEVKVVGPLQSNHRTHLSERIIKRIHSKLTHKKYSKFPVTSVYQTSRILTRAVREWRPDVVFTIFPASLVNYKGEAPVIYRVDTTIKSIQEYRPVYDPLSYRMMRWVEERAFQKVSRFITQSIWCKDVLVRDYGVPEDRITVFANPAALPPEVVPETLDATCYQPVDPPLRLLLVGRDYERKGIDIAIEVTRQLNASGLSTTLTVAGLDGNDTEYVHFAGFFDKRDPEQLKQYVDLYRTAHLLIHPARFEAAGIVPGEAAAFAVPTVTNDVGGLATTVQDDVSGVVLPGHSPAEAYAEAISQLASDADRYVSLCRSTRERFERELNWNVTGKIVADVLEEATMHHQVD